MSPKISYRKIQLKVRKISVSRKKKEEISTRQNEKPLVKVKSRLESYMQHPETDVKLSSP
jgi:hypothetical protein